MTRRLFPPWRQFFGCLTGIDRAGGNDFARGRIARDIESLTIPPEANERGWKDTVRVNPGELCRIAAEFADYPGRFVYHCHILEHEDNEMMRPFEVVSADGVRWPLLPLVKRVR